MVARCCKHPLIGGSTKHSPCLGSCLATILTIKDVLLAPKSSPKANCRHSPGTAHGCLLLILPLLVPEPWKARLVAADVFHQLLLWLDVRLDVQLDVSKQLQLRIPLHTF